MYETILFTIEEGVATITLNRPESLNALNQQMAEELLDALERCKQDAVRAVVIKGAGRGFCAGGDVRAMRELVEKGAPEEFFRDALGAVHQAILAIRNLPKPVLASIHGFASGAGFNLALACDLRIATETARFNQAFVRLGLIPDAGGTFFLPRMVGLGKASELFFSGEFLDAPEALRLGFLNRVVPEGELESATRELATRLAKGPTLAIGRIKALINQGLVATDLASHLEREQQAQIASSRTEDFQAGVAAFFEKREPEFKGR
ncbi:MAG: enoyl-CoA hydratase/isomerase family protein [Anaerolineae bacterium]